ncbi:hypothetical protein OD350_29350 (plasmid) [Clostridium beijerinckii]|uniref:hypothetical protein n=1 Tax=Clostridium beijerinckii TaxID=1520 RepID=UPI0022260934|nr:hypothetical protein [Clostridium beijerinckii]UYZ38996.1 hypothetical protein OD350_29350 [Clostridium beijerinckii]
MEMNLFSMFDDEPMELEQEKKELVEKKETTSANLKSATEENKDSIDSTVAAEGNDVQKIEITEESNNTENGNDKEESEVKQENISLLPGDTDNKKKQKSKKEENKSKPKVDPNKTIEDEIKKFTRVVVKAYGSELFTIEGETEVQSIKLPEIADRLINEFQYGEFSAGIRWHAVPNNDKTVGYLIATGNFYAKG